MLLVFGAPCQLPSLAGQEHGRTIPLTDMAEPNGYAQVSQRCPYGALAKLPQALDNVSDIGM